MEDGSESLTFKLEHDYQTIVFWDLCITKEKQQIDHRPFLENLQIEFLSVGKNLKDELYAHSHDFDRLQAEKECAREYVICHLYPNPCHS